MKRRRLGRGEWRQWLARGARIFGVDQLSRLRLVALRTRQPFNLSLRVARTGFGFEPAVVIRMPADHPVVPAVAHAGLVDRERQGEGEVLA